MENSEKVIFMAEADQAKERLDKVVAAKIDCSRKRSDDLLEAGLVLVNGKKEKPSYKVKEGDEISVEIPPLEDSEVLPEEMDLDIVYEDSDLIIVNKPRGLVVHPAPGHTKGTLVNGILAHCKDLSGINGVMRPGIVHRIDKDTSGLLIICKNDAAHEAISKQLSDKSCFREYTAIVHHPFPHINGTVNAPIGRDDKDRQKMKVTDKNAKEAVTHFEVIKNFKDYALIKCRLETGRTHQIRVHMSYIDHPVAGDPKYAYRRTIPASGQLLCATGLTLTHPTTKERMHFEIEPDDEIKSVLEQLEAGTL